MNKYKVHKTATIKQDKKRCIICNDKVFKKHRNSGYEIEREGEEWVTALSGKPITTPCCSEQCVNAYILQHMDDPTSSLGGSFDKFIFPLMKVVYPNLISNTLVNVQPMPAKLSKYFAVKKKKKKK